VKAIDFDILRKVQRISACFLTMMWLYLERSSEEIRTFSAKKVGQRISNSQLSLVLFTICVQRVLGYACIFPLRVETVSHSVTFSRRKLNRQNSPYCVPLNAKLFCGLLRRHEATLFESLFFLNIRQANYMIAQFWISIVFSYRLENHQSFGIFQDGFFCFS
jgi:hypothetical protein